MIRLVSASRLRCLSSTGSPTRTRISGRSARSKRGRRRLRGHTCSVPHRPTGMTGAWVAWARRAAPQRPFSSGSKNAGPRGIVPSGRQRHGLAGPQGADGVLQRLARTRRAVDPDAAGHLRQEPDDRGVEDLLLAEEAERAPGLAEHGPDDGGVEVAAVVEHGDHRAASSGCSRCRRCRGGRWPAARGAAAGRVHSCSSRPAILSTPSGRSKWRSGQPFRRARATSRTSALTAVGLPDGVEQRGVVVAVAVGPRAAQVDAGVGGPRPDGLQLAPAPHERAVDLARVGAVGRCPLRGDDGVEAEPFGERRDERRRAGRRHDEQRGRPRGARPSRPGRTAGPSRRARRRPPRRRPARRRPASRPSPWRPGGRSAR